MSKLLKFKEWLTLPAAAHLLSSTLKEPVSEADVLQLALEEQLTLSVHISDNVFATRAKIVPRSSAMMFLFQRETDALPALIGEGLGPEEIATLPLNIQEGLATGKLVLIPMGDAVNDAEFIEHEDEVVSLPQGVYDLPLIGAERFEIADRLQVGNRQAERNYDFANGVIISAWGELHRLMIALKNPEANFEAEARLRLYQAKLINIEDWREYGPLRFVPSNCLPSSAILVVRTSAMYDFQRQVLAPEKDRPVSTKERETFLNIIGVLAKTDCVWDGKQPNAFFELVAKRAAAQGLPIPSKNTFVGKLKEAAELLPNDD